MKRSILFIIVAVLALAGFGIYKLAGSMGRAGERGDAAVATFHGHFNAKRVETIHTTATAGFRSAVPLESFTSFVTMLHEKLGVWKSGERTGINLQNNDGNTTLVLSYAAVFANAAGTEEFTFDYNGDEPLLLGYDVKSPALIQTPANPTQTPAPAQPAP